MLGSLVSLVITDVFFGLALLFCAVFGFIGILEDEDKASAIIALLLPLAFIAVVVIQFASTAD